MESTLYYERDEIMESLSFKEYQEVARTTAIYSLGDRIVYPALGLASEAGEVCGKIKKILRDNNGELTEERRLALRDELGDVLWYVSNLASDLDLDLCNLASLNLSKLLSRQTRGVLQGNGDNR